MSYDKLIKSGRRRPFFTPGETTRTVSIGRADIERLVPHRDPFLLVDEITALDLDEKAALGKRVIDPADPILKGHFPGEPIYPGFLMLEMMGQCGLCLNYLGGLSRLLGDYETARSRFERCLSIHQKALGPEHPRTIKSMISLA